MDLHLFMKMLGLFLKREKYHLYYLFQLKQLENMAQLKVARENPKAAHINGQNGAQTNQHDDDQYGEQEGHQIPAALGRGVDVQEAHQMHHDLHNAHDEHADQVDALAELPAHHHPERDGSEDHRQDETDSVRAVAAVAGAGVGMRMTHQIVPIR